MGYKSKSKKHKKKEKAGKDDLKYVSLFVGGILLFLVDGLFDLWWLRLGSILIILYSILPVWLVIKKVLDFYFPVKGIDFKYKHASLMGYIFLVVAFISFLILWEENTLSSGTLFWSSFIVGVVIAIVLLFVLHLVFRDLLGVSMRRYNLFTALILAFPLITIGGVSHYNVALANEGVYCDNTILLDKSITEGDSSDSYYFYFLIDEEEVNFEVDTETWSSFKFGDILEVCLIDGYFGFETVAFVEGYNPEWDKDYKLEE